MFLRELNDAQREAVTHREGPLLVLAGAGSGKTRVITYRIAQLVLSGAPPETLLALSFTNKAAREVRERVASLLARRKVPAEGLTVCTFHSLGLNILKTEGRRIGLGAGFSLLSEGERRSLVRQIVKEAAPTLDPVAVGDALSAWKNRGLTLEEAQRDARPEHKTLLKLYATYTALLRAQRAVDFDDLLLLPLAIFRESPDACHLWGERFHHLLVDEYQDTNRVQFELLKVLAGRRENLCVVGDDDQSIYGWRGAEVDLILRFPEHFPKARVVVLDENYRSSATILDAAHAVVSGLASRHEKKLRTSLGSGAPLSLLVAADETEEAERVASEILAETYKTRRPFGDFAVLYRTNGQSRAFELAFRAHEIPHVVVGGNRFFDRKEVRDVLSYLKAMANPRDDASLLRIANVPKRGLGHQTILKLQEDAASRGVSLSRALSEAEDLPPAARGGAASLLALLDDYRGRFHGEGVTAAGLDDFIKAARLREDVRASYESPRAVERRLATLDELVASVEAAGRGRGKLSLHEFLETVTLDPPEDREEEEADAVRLMTLHAAKGLEFPWVFLTGLEEGLLPLGREEGTIDPEEERRLCYVGMTRAKTRLILTRAQARSRRGASRRSLPSRFWDEIPGALAKPAADAPEPTEEEKAAMAKNFFANIQGLLGGK